MATVTKSIGTSSRDYSTITAWEADLDDTNIYTSGDDAVGECYNDSVFAQADNLLIRGGGAVGLNSVTLTAATTERHDGTAGTGAEITVPSMKRIYMQAGFDNSVSIKGVVSWLDINGQSYGRTRLFLFYTDNDELKNCICRGVGDQVGPPRTSYNNIIYTGGAFANGGNFGTSGAGNISNNTVYGVNRGITVGIANSNVSIKNNICAGTSVVDFDGSYGDVGYGVPQVSNNLSSDATAPGTDSLTGKTAANQFVSTVSGSEDLHLKAGADAIGTGEDLGSSPAGVQYDIDGYDRDAGDRVWDIGADQAIGSVVKTIGTAGRDYSTITAWEAGLSTILYQTGDEAVGECYNDSIFNEGVVINNGSQVYGNGVELSHIKLSAPLAERHDGTFGTGATISYATYGSRAIWVQLNYTTIEWLCVIASGGTSYAPYIGIQVTSAANFGVNTGYANIRNNIIKSGGGTWPVNGGNGGIFLQGPDTNCHNNIVYDWEFPSYAGISNYYNNQNVYNNTIYNCNTGMLSSGVGNMTSKNNISVGNSVQDYNGSSGTYTSSNNLSSDGTADDYGGTDHVVNAVTANQFVSTVSGSEDLHILSTSDAVGAGIDLGTTPDGVQYDIDGVDRDARGTAWDIGADQAVATVVKTIGTSSRDYSTITAWEAVLDDPIYQTGDDAVGECYNDSTFVEGFTIDGGSTVGLNSILLIPETSERHDGTADTGVKVQTLSYGGGNDRYSLGSTTPTLELRYIEIERNVNSEQGLVSIGSNNVFNAGIIRTSTGSPVRDMVGMGFGTGYLYNSILYGVTGKGVNFQSLYSATPEVINNTIIAQHSYCLYARDKANGQANAKVKNNILIANGTSVAVDPGGTTPTSFPDYANNITNYSSFPNGLANLSDHITDIDETQQFVSIVSGSEDYHLSSTSDAIGAGEDIVATKSSTTNSYYLENTQYDIDGVDRDARGTAWDIGADQAPGTITKTIGTAGRDYSTITAWEAVLDGNIYQSDDDAVGECYNDSNFTAGGTIDGGGTVGLNSVELTVANGEHHDGTAGTGAKIVSQANYGGVSGGNTLPVHVSLLEVDYNSFRVGAFSGNGGSGVNQYSRLLLYNGYLYGNLFYFDYYAMNIFNNIIFDLEGGYRNMYAIRTTSSAPSYIVNNTIHDIHNSGNGYYLRFGGVNCKNCIASNVGGSGFIHSNTPTTSNNLSSDATADDGIGTGHIINAVTDSQFVSTVSGSEDLHLKSGADAIGVGVDLGSSPAGVQYDIDGVDRDARGTAWDIGADQAAGVVVQTIGSAGRDYSTITAWEAALDGNTYQSGDDAVGECYNDSDFDESPTIDGGGTVGLNSRTIKVANGEKHDGTVGTGVRLLNSTSATKLSSTQSFANGFATRISGLEVDNNARFTVSYIAIKSISPVRADVVIDNCIAHNTTGLANVRGFEITNSWYNEVSINNCIAYDIGVTSGANSVATGFYVAGSLVDILSCVAYDITSTVNVLGRGYQAHPSNHRGGHELKNSISMGCEVDIVGFNANGHTNTNCLTSDATADGTGGIINKAASDQFVSTVAGSEDLHLLKTADAVGAGADLSSYTTTSDGNDTFSAIDINGSNRAAFTGNAWDIGSHQYALTASIGTSSRDYSTITAWEADLDNTAKYGNGSNAVGECYNDSTFNAAGIRIDGGTTVGLSSVKLSVAETERHDGTLSAGVHINPTYSLSYIISTSRSNTIIEWLTLKTNGTSTYSHGNMVTHDIYSSNTISRYMVLQGEDKVYPAQTPIGIRTGGNENIAHNNIIYGIANGSVGGGIYDSYRRCNAYNNTIYGCNYGYYATQQGSDTRNIKNNLNIGNNYDFYADGTGGYVSSNNASSDSTATVFGGSDHITGASALKQFISTTPGSEDLHLVMGSDALNVGADLGSTPEGVQYDIDGYDRTASITWDIGADEAHEIDGEFGYKGFLSYINRTTLHAG